jgi:Cd2+/Zn2+-exporting ATPase
MPSTKTELLFRIHGMDCAEEVAILKREVGPAVGGEERLSFDLLNGRMGIAAESGATPSEVQAVVARTGMRAEVWTGEGALGDRGRFWERRGRTILTALSGLLAVLGFLAHAYVSGFSAALGAEGAGEEGSVPLLSKILYGAGILSGVWYFLPKAWYSARRLRPDMNLLMTVAVLGAVALGEWLEGVTVAFLFAVSLALESWSVGRARRAIEALMDLAAPVARVRQDGHEVEVPPDQVPVGNVFIVRPGEKLPLDGRVVRGESDVNQAPITGESAPVTKLPGDTVFAGTINGNGALEIESTKPASDTTLAHIIKMVGEAQSRRAPSERWVETFARYYTPAVLAVALLVLLIPPLVLNAQWSDWVYRALVLLVIACPCALVISTPVSIVAALAASARHGVLIKGGVYVEAPARLKAIALDKTGTLTEGRPRVVELVPLDGHDERELLERVAAMEARSDHPLARAIMEYAASQGVRPPAAEDFQMIQGKGASATIAGRKFWVGSHRYLEERGQETPEVHDRLEAMSQAGRSVVVVGNDEHVCGFIALADAVRPQARETLQALRAAGLEHIIMLTGDNRGTAEAVGRETGVDEVMAELLPEDKVRTVETLVSRYGSVAMVGDGVNDAPALGRATIGIAMGAAGSDAAIETADIALMSDDLSKLPWIIQHSRRTMSVIRQNVAFSLGVKTLFVILTFVGYSSLWAAIAADMGASFLVIFNGLRLLGTPDELGAEATNVPSGSPRVSTPERSCGACCHTPHGSETGERTGT